VLVKAALQGASGTAGESKLARMLDVLEHVNDFVIDEINSPEA
jgi:hypothetical protein